MPLRSFSGSQWTTQSTAVGKLSISHSNGMVKRRDALHGVRFAIGEQHFHAFVSTDGNDEPNRGRKTTPDNGSRLASHRVLGCDRADSFEFSSGAARFFLRVAQDGEFRADMVCGERSW